MNRRKCIIVFALLLLPVLVVPPFCVVYRQTRQARLDYALITAIKSRNDKKALEALAEGANGEARDTGEPELSVVQALLEHGANVNDRDANGKSALFYFYDFSNMKALRLLLERGGNFEARDVNMRTPLIWATMNGNPKVVRILLENGAKVSPKDYEDCDALYFVQHETSENAALIAALLRKYGTK